jgi:hypothetical protein
LKIEFKYAKHADLVFHVLAYLKVNNASDLYDQEYIGKMAIEKEKRNFKFNIIQNINSLHEYYNNNSQRLSMINFLPFYCIDFNELKNMLVSFNQFSQDDIHYFINPFIKIMENELAFYYDYWDKLHNSNKVFRDKTEKYIKQEMGKFNCIFEYYNKSSLAYMSYSITKNGRGFHINGCFSAAVPFPKNNESFQSSFFTLLHEYTHQFTDNLLNTDINFADGSHNLSEYAVILTDYYLIKAIDESMVPNYIRMFTHSESETEFLNTYKVGQNLEEKIKELIGDILKK